MEKQGTPRIYVFRDKAFRNKGLGHIFVYFLYTYCLHIIYVVLPNYLTSSVADKIMSITIYTV